MEPWILTREKMGMCSVRAQPHPPLRSCRVPSCPTSLTSCSFLQTRGRESSKLFTRRVDAP